MTRKTSADFKVGQTVRHTDPSRFRAPIDKFLTNRLGEVVEVYPVDRTNAFHVGHINRVRVKWLKRANRGKELIRIEYPYDLEVVS